MEGLFATLLLCWWLAENVAGQSFSCDTANSLRLNSANYFTNDRSGRVEICSCDSEGLNCEWATITVSTTFTSWGWKNALVACRELFPEDYGVMNPILQDTLPDAARASDSQAVWSSWVLCDGTEARIFDCNKFPSVSSHERDAHIQCRSGEPADGDIRLTGYAFSSSQGIVEYYQGTSMGWVTLCTELWDAVDANVACVQLGYESGTVQNLQTTFFGTSYGPLGLYNVQCGGSELMLSSCSAASSGSCADTSFRAGVQCTASGLTVGSVRLSSVTQSGNSQRVEVLYDERWGTVCREGWDTSDGNVVCRALGLGKAVIENSPTFDAMSGVRPIWLTEVPCGGSEAKLADCTSGLTVGYTPSCSHAQDAAVACIPEDRFCNVANTVRLNQASYFSDSRAGRVEICNCDLPLIGCEWVTIPVPSSSISWGWKNAQVVCRQLFPQDYGVRNPLLQDTLPSGVQASSSRLVHPYYFLCDGTESNLDQCSKTATLDSSHFRDAHIQCRLNEPVQGDVRLSSSSANNAFGVVEVYRSDTQTWVTPCGDFWDDEDANVSCVQLGYESGTAEIYETSNFAGTNYGDLGLFEVSCAGTEAYLDSCTYSTFGSCTNSNGRGGVVCISSELDEGSVRLDPGYNSDNSIHRVEILYDGRWGTVCSTSWEVEDAIVVCSAFGGDSPDIVDSSSLSPESYGNPIWLSTVTCEGTETALTECISTLPVGYVPSCTHANDAAVTCGEDGSVSAGAIVGIVMGSVVVLGVLLFIIIHSDQHRKKQVADAWARVKQRVRNVRQAAARKCAAVKTFIKEAPSRRAAGRQAAARESVAREGVTNREAIAREEAAMAEATRTEETSVQVHAVIENDRSQRQTEDQAAASSSAGNRAAPANMSHSGNGATAVADSTLREGAPPSYDDVLRWNAPGEAKQSPSTLHFYPSPNPSSLPYPMAADVPAYPNAPYQGGYPPPTHPAFPPPIVNPLQPPMAPMGHPNQPLEGASYIDSPLPPPLPPIEDGDNM